MIVTIAVQLAAQVAAHRYHVHGDARAFTWLKRRLPAHLLREFYHAYLLAALCYGYHASCYREARRERLFVVAAFRMQRALGDALSLAGPSETVQVAAAINALMHGRSAEAIAYIEAREAAPALRGERR